MTKSTDKLAHHIRDEYEQKYGISHKEAERIGHSTVNKMKKEGKI